MDLLEIEQALAALPRGYISRKTIRGKVYPYHQWSEKGVKKSRYVPPEELAQLEALLERRRELEQQRRLLRTPAPRSVPALTGSALLQSVQGAAGLTPREALAPLEQFLGNPETDRVCVLFGLRGSGKTTLMRQAILRMSPAGQRQSVYLKLRSQDSMAELEGVLERFYRRGFRFFFLDEVAQLADFPQRGGALADFAAVGAKLVLSGGDSYAFCMAQERCLYDQLEFVPVAGVSYREQRRIWGGCTLEAYLTRGGFLRADSPGLLEGAESYINNAICKNLRENLERWGDGAELRLLEELSGSGNLDWAIRRSLEQFCLELVPPSREFQEFLSLRQVEEWSYGLGPGQLAQIKEALKRLDILTARPTEFLDGRGAEVLCFTQSGLCWSLARSLLEEPELVMPRLMGDTVLLEARRCLAPEWDVFRVESAQGAMDLVIRNRRDNRCGAYTISPSSQDPDLTPLTDRALLERIARRFGPVTEKGVLYPGPSLDGPFGILFRNVEEFLTGL